MTMLGESIEYLAQARETLGTVTNRLQANHTRTCLLMRARATSLSFCCFYPTTPPKALASGQRPDLADVYGENPVIVKTIPLMRKPADEPCANAGGWDEAKPKTGSRVPNRVLAEPATLSSSLRCTNSGMCLRLLQKPPIGVHK